MTCWQDVVLVLRMLVADRARSGYRRDAPSGGFLALTIGAIFTVIMGHLKDRSVRVDRWAEIAVDVTMRVAAILILRKERIIVTSIKDTDRSTDII